MKFCARSATRSAVAGAGGASRRFSPSLIGSWLGFRWGKLVGGEPRALSCQSPSCLYGATRWGPTSLILGWALPIRARVKGPVDRWANWWRSTQHSPPWSHLLLLASYVLLLFIFHHRLMHRAVSSSRSVADRFNSYNTCLCSEIDTLTLGPFIVRKI